MIFGVYYHKMLIIMLKIFVGLSVSYFGIQSAIKRCKRFCFHLFCIFFIYNFLTEAGVVLSYCYVISDIEQNLAILGMYNMPY